MRYIYHVVDICFWHTSPHNWDLRYTLIHHDVQSGTYELSTPHQDGFIGMFSCCVGILSAQAHYDTSHTANLSDVWKRSMLFCNTRCQVHTTVDKQLDTWNYFDLTSNHSIISETSSFLWFSIWYQSFVPMTSDSLASRWSSIFIRD